MFTRKTLDLPTYPQAIPQSVESPAELRAQIDALRKEHYEFMRAMKQYVEGLNKPNVLEINGAQITASSGIIFPATQVASTDLNTLDDYEESPANVAATIGPQGGAFTATATYNYTKKGREVFVEVQAVITNVGTGTGVVDVNIPFIPARQTAGSGVGTTSTTGIVCFAHNNGGQGQIRFFKPDGTTAIAVGTFYLAATFNV